MTYEYRITWKRFGMLPVSQIRQTEKGARAKIAALIWSDVQPKTESIEGVVVPTEFKGMPPLEYVRVSRRTVGEWEAFDAVAPEPSHTGEAA